MTQATVSVTQHDRLTIRPWYGHDLKEYEEKECKTRRCIAIEQLEPVHSSLICMSRLYRRKKNDYSNVQDSQSSQTYLKDEAEPNYVRYGANECNEELFVRSECVWPLIYDCRDEAFHCTELRVQSKHNDHHEEQDSPEWREGQLQSSWRICQKRESRSFINHVFDGLILFFGHEAKDGKDDKTSEERSPGIDAWDDDGVSEMCVYVSKSMSVVSKPFVTEKRKRVERSIREE